MRLYFSQKIKLDPWCLIFFLVLLFGCSRPLKQIPIENIVFPKSSPLKSLAYYQLTYMKKRLSGRVFILADLKGNLYFEGLNPIGWPIFQGNLRQDKINFVLFPQKKVFKIKASNIPNFLKNSWGYLLQGQIPPYWLKKTSTLYEYQDSFRNYFSIEEYEIYLLFNKSYQLKKITIEKEGETLLRFSYLWQQQKLTCITLEKPNLSLTLKLNFQKLEKTSLSPEQLKLKIPSYFSLKVYNFNF